MSNINNYNKLLIHISSKYLQTNFNYKNYIEVKIVLICDKIKLNCDKKFNQLESN